MNLKQDRQGVRTAPDLERKYNLGQDKAISMATTAQNSANEAQGTANNAYTMAENAEDMAENAQGIAQSAKTDVTNLTTRVSQLEHAGVKSHASTHAAGGSDPLTPAAIGAVQSQVFVIYTAEQTLLEYITEKINEGYTSGVIQIFGAQLSDVPTSVGTYALVTYQKHADNYVMVSLVTDGGVDIRVRKFIFLQTDWHTTDWVLMYSTNNKPTPADIGAVSKSGDTMTGDLIVDGEVGVSSSSTRSMYLECSPSGNVNIYNAPKGDFNNTVRLHLKPETGGLDDIFYLGVTENGSTNFYKLYGEHYKPTPAEIGAVSKAGDTMTGTLNIVPTGQAAIGMKSSGDASDSWIYADSGYIEMMVREKSDGTTYRGLVVRDATRAATLVNALGFYDRVNSVTTHYNVFGQHNKPTGTYTGTGSSTSQTKTIGGIGKALLITSDYAVGIVTQHGALFGRVSSTTAAYDTFTDTEINFTDGVLTIKSTSSYFNGSSYEYTYQVL